MDTKKPKQEKWSRLRPALNQYDEAYLAYDEPNGKTVMVSEPKPITDVHRSTFEKAVSDIQKPTKRFSNGGKVRGCGQAVRGLTKGRMR